jgi:hypothetical protein
VEVSELRCEGGLSDQSSLSVPTCPLRRMLPPAQAVEPPPT